MDKFIVFLIIALAAGYVIRRFFFSKKGGCGCGCSGGCPSQNGSASSCCEDKNRLQ